MGDESTDRYQIGGMDCAACQTKIETAVGRIPGVSEVASSFTTGAMKVTHDGKVQRSAVERAVTTLGYSLAPETAKIGSNAEPHHDDDDGGDAPWWRTRKAILTLACGAALLAAYLTGQVFPEFGYWAFLAALLVGLVPVVRRALAGAMAGSAFTIETLMTIAAVGAVIIGATEEAATVVLFFLVGELLEGVAASRARASIRSLADLIPKTALIEEGGYMREVPANSLRIGSVIVVRPGDRVTADGEILEGSSSIDDSPVTGESAPKSKSAGDKVFAGTINADGVLRVRVTATAEDNTIARVVKLVEEAQESKAPTERFIVWFSKYYTPGVLVVGALVAVVPPLAFGLSWNEWVYKGLAVLLIGCPCALVISTPAAIAAGLSAGARRGLLIKGGATLEKLRRVTAVAFDKTGTLTEGKPVVTDVVGFSRSASQVLSLSAALESGSSHPLAKAILARAVTDKAPVPPAVQAKAVPGKGVTGRVGAEDVFLASLQAAEAVVPLTVEQRQRVAALNDEGKTVSVLVVGHQVAGVLALRDESRSDAAVALAMLRDAAVSTVMLTGDNKRTAEAIGKALGIDVRAELLPEDKQRIVRELQAEGKIVAKVGDGINDAPALAAADIGIAMGGGTDVALETADAAALHGRVSDIPNMIALSRSVMGNIAQNITIALGLKAVFLATTIIGVTGLWPAILADTGATVLVTANAMRLLGWKNPN